MRPLRLSMTAFGPYPETEVVDFDALADLGLFAVAGRNGSGKTTIFDGLYFALYGSLPGRRASYHRLRSDHARADLECRVELDFVAQGEHWRIERFPRQRSAKRRGTGDVERQQRATLYRVVDGEPSAVVNRIRDVDATCRSLIGLSGPQFERVALLPQGEFSRLLRESSADRRSLLRALFSSDVFGDATKMLVDDAAALGRDHDAAATALDDHLGRIVRQVNDLSGAELDADHVSIAEAIDEFETTELVPLRARVEQLRQRAGEHAAAVQRARDVIERIDRRTGVEAAIDEHRSTRADNERDLDRLERARAAVPVVDMAQVAHRQRAAHVASTERVAEIQTALLPPLQQVLGRVAAVPDDLEALDTLVVVIDAEAEQLTALTAAADDVERLGTAVGDLNAEVGRLHDHEQRVRADRQRLAARRVELETERDQLDEIPDVTEAQRVHDAVADRFAKRRQLHDLDAEFDDLGARARRHAERRASLDVRLGDAERAQRRLTEANERARNAADALAELHRRRDVRVQFESAVARLDVARSELTVAREAHDRRFDAFIRGTSARLAETLVDGEPCAVCGSTAHPEPAVASDLVVTQHEVSQARRTLDQAASLVTQLEHELATLTATDADLASLDRTDLDERIESALAEALATENDANETTRAAHGLDDIRCELQTHEQNAHAIDARRHEIDQARHHLSGVLGDDARRSIADLRGDVRRADSVLRSAIDARPRHRALRADLVDVDAQIEATELAELDVRARLAATEAEYSARYDDLARASALLEAGEPSSPSGGPTADPGPGSAAAAVRSRLDDANRCRTLLARLRAAFAERATTADARRRADLTLQEKLEPSPFATVDAARAAALDSDTVASLEASTAAWSTRHDQLHGERQALGDVPDIRPDLHALTQTMAEAEADWHEAHRRLTREHEACIRLRDEITGWAEQHDAQGKAAADAQRLERIAALVKGDNDHNTSLENWVLAAHLRDVVQLANVRLAASTQQRFQLCVLDDGEHRRGRWGLDLAVEDTVTGTRRPTAGLSGGELFQASLALALGLADVVMNQTAGVQIDALFIDEGFGSLDERSVERVIDLLDDVRSRGAMVGVITHVSALLDALPRGITVVPRPDGDGSTIRQSAQAA